MSAAPNRSAYGRSRTHVQIRVFRIQFPHFLETHGADKVICFCENELSPMTSHMCSAQTECAYLIQRGLPRPLLDLGKDHRVHGGQAAAHRPRRVKRGGEIDERQNARDAKVEPPQHQETRPVKSVWGRCKREHSFCLGNKIVNTSMMLERIFVLVDE